MIWIIFLCGIMGVSTALAKGPPAKVTIEGPGIKSPLEFTDPELLQAFSLFQFEDIEHPIPEPKDTGPGFVITRHVEVSASLTPWDRLIYYPGSGKAKAIVFLEGIIGPDASEFDGHWYAVSRDGNAAMKKILQGAGIAVGKAEVEKPVQGKQAEATPSKGALQSIQPFFLVGIGLAMLILAGGGYLFLKRRSTLVEQLM